MSTPENDPQPDGNSTTPPLPSTQGTNSTPAPFGSTRFSQVSRKSIPPRSFQPAQGQQSIATSLISAYGEDTLEHTDAAHPSFSPVLSHADGESLLVGTPFEASKANEVTLDDLKHSRHGPVRSWFTRWFLEWWLLEIISWLVSAVSIIIISWVLLRYDGHLQEEWGMSMSVNSFISTFSGLSKSAILLFVGEALAQLKWEHFDKSERKGFQRLDSASRGPMGSLILLVRSRRFNLASFGAAIVLLSIPLDGFFQRLISFPSVEVFDRSNATISRAIIYDPDPKLSWLNGTSKFGPDAQLDAYANPFWLNGIASLISPGVELQCETGNCTYDPFLTLALDFRCQEILNFVEFGCKTTSAEWMTTVAYQGPDSSPNVMSCGYYINIPGHQPQLMSGYEIQGDGLPGEVLATRFFPIMDLATNEIYFGGSPSFGPSLKNPVTDFIMVSTPGSFDGALNNKTPVVTECEIHWVVNLIQANVTASILVEKALETLQFESDFDNPWDPADPTKYRANFSLTLPDPHSVTGNYSTFGLSNTTAYQVAAVWSELVPSTYNKPADDNPVKSGPVLKYRWFQSPPSLVQVLTGSLPWDTPNNVTEHMANAVTVMNQVIRRNFLSHRGRHDVSTGITFIHAVIIHVHWMEMSLPIIVVVISGLFLIATISRKPSTSKTPPLATLLDDQADEAIKMNLRGRSASKRPEPSVSETVVT